MQEDRKDIRWKRVRMSEKNANGRSPKYDEELARINLKVPAKIKEYLTVAAAKASIDQKRNISLTEYLCIYRHGTLKGGFMAVKVKNQRGI